MNKWMSDPANWIMCMIIGGGAGILMTFGALLVAKLIGAW